MERSSYSLDIVHGFEYDVEDYKEFFENIVEAEDGAIAWSKLSEHPDTQLIISDWNMPNMDGEEVVNRMVSNGSIKKIKVINPKNSFNNDSFTLNNNKLMREIKIKNNTLELKNECLRISKNFFTKK